jgi:hypothetical protein
METIIGIISKSPHPIGRIGPTKYQDWYRQCIDVVKLNKKIPNSNIVLTSNLQINNARREEDYYSEIINGLSTNLITLNKGVETTEQLLVFKEYSLNKKLILSVTFTHFFRVWWIAKRIKLNVIKYKISLGIPRPKELITDIILTFLYPIIDLMGYSKWFIENVIKRRNSGKF